MAEGPRFLLGAGERLTEPIEAPSGGGPKRLPYSLAEAKQRLTPMLGRTASDIAALPQAACPNDEAVIALTLHPQFIAKSYFPDRLLRQTHMEAIGSRPRRITPSKWTKKGLPEESETTDLFLAGPREALAEWARQLPDWNGSLAGADQLRQVEEVRPFTPEDRIRHINPEIPRLHLEAVLHLPTPSDTWILAGFRDFLDGFDVESYFERRLHAGGLCFVPMSARPGDVKQLAQFSFLRVLRSVPRLRPLEPITRVIAPGLTFDAKLPSEEPVDVDLRAAVFDGGLPESHGMERWVDLHEVDVSSSDPGYVSHGGQVTSALLFGSLEDGAPARRPYCYVDHYRVLDEDSAKDPFELYGALNRIKKVLQTGRYQFINLSIGPSVPVDDDDVHTWTAVLDELLANGDTFAASAVGNNGEMDWDSGEGRIQVPADCVNGLAVGASDRTTDPWERAPYSAVGPGRSPGIVKPDVLAFGGSSREPFWVVNPDNPPATMALAGTSFSSPIALRLAVGLRAHFGAPMSPLALKALLIHRTEEGRSKRECGWGRLPAELEDLVVCPEGVVRVVYQGEIRAAQFIRAQVPMPKDVLGGMVTLSTTIVYACEVDPQDPGNYTRAGLDVVFRPHSERFRSGGTYPDSRAFFQRGQFEEEQELRRDAHKWETALHRSLRMRGSSLKDAMFDLHYVARAAGAPARDAGRIKYAMVVSLEASRAGEIYDRVLNRYRSILVPLRPRVQIPVRASA